MTTNDQVFDAQVEHQISVNLAANDAAARLLAELAKADREALALIERFDPDDALAGNRSRRLEAITRRLEESARDLNTVLNDEAIAEIEMVAEQEEEFNEELFIALALLLGLSVEKAKLSEVRRAAVQGEFGGGLLRSGKTREHVAEFNRKRLRQLRDEIRLGFTEGLSAAQIIRNIRGTASQRFRNGILNRLRNDLKQIGHSAIIHASNAASSVFAAANRTVFSEIWIATLDGKLCPICAALHKRRFARGEGPFPPRHPNCRCKRIPFFKAGGAFASPDFDDWLRGEPVAVADQVLGKTRSKLFRDGDLTVERFVDNPFRRTNPTRLLTLEELRASDSRTIQEAFKKAGLES